MKYIALAFLLMATSLSAQVQSEGAADLPKITIGLVLDGESPRFGGIDDVLRNEAVSLLSKDYDIRLPVDKVILGNWSLASVGAAYESLVEDDEVDLIVCLGTLGTESVSNRERHAKPVVAISLLSPELRKLPRDGAGSGVPNFHYLTVPGCSEVESFRELVEFERLAILVDGVQYDAIPEGNGCIADLASPFGENTKLVRFYDDLGSVFTELDKDVDAVLIQPQVRMTAEEFERLLDEMNRRKLPSFSLLGALEVQEGVLAGLKPLDFIQHLARRASLNIQRILGGEDAGRIPVLHTFNERLTINMATARAIGFYPRWKIQMDADLISDEKRPAGRSVSLEQVVLDAVGVNLDLISNRHQVEAGSKDVALAAANLLPQIQIAANYTMIDEDRAAASMGSAPEQLLTASATLTQILFNEQAWANHSIQKSVQKSRELQLQTLRLDIGFQAAATYLNVLRAKSSERIQKHNLRLTRENLKLAEVRESLGATSPGELYRWQAQLALAQQRVISAIALRNQAEMEVNRLLNRPLEESFVASENELDQKLLAEAQQRLAPYIDNPWSFRLFRNFMAEEALRGSPEIEALGAVELAQKRLVSSSSRSFWLPSLALQAGTEERLDASGAGSTGSALGESFGLPTADDNNWFAALQLSYPLFSGGRRFAEKSQATADLARIRTEKSAASERVEQRMRVALHDMGASYAGIELADEAAEASWNNYRLVSDAYRQGAVSIIDLLDAQNAALGADQGAANARFGFLIDLMRVQRASGRLEYLSSPEEREDFWQRLSSYYDAVQ